MVEVESRTQHLADSDEYEAEFLRIYEEYKDFIEHKIRENQDNI